MSTRLFERMDKVAKHKFVTGDRVRLRPAALRKAVVPSREAMAAHEFEVLRTLPRESAAFQYHVRNNVTGQQRLVDELDLDAAD